MPASADDLARLHAAIPQLWRGRGQPSQLPTQASGHAALDALLPGAGWPVGALTELLHDQPGLGELSLFLPAMIESARQRRRIALIAPPLQPNGPALAARGLDLEQVLLIASERDADSRWAAEQCLRSGLFGVVLLWPGACGDHELRRLQLAAEPSRAVSVLHRPTHYAQLASPAQLRLRLQPGAPSSRPEPYPMPSQPRLQILKARGLNCSPNAPIEVNGLQLLPLYAGVAGNAYAAVNSSQDEPAVIDFRRLEAPMSEKSQLSSV
jgi:protein ImuA